jgi:hypothetical protein
MKGQTAIEYLMTYGWAILIILIVAGVLAYYGIFAPSGFLGPTARGFGQLQVLNPWSLSAATGILTLNVENRVGGTINITTLNMTLDGNPYTSSVSPQVQITSGENKIVPGTFSIPPLHNKGDSYTATITIYYNYSGQIFSSTGTISGTYS